MKKQSPLTIQLMAGFSRLSAYAVTIGPYILTLSAVILTVSGARLISYLNPGFHWELQSGLHVHHYTFGIFALAIAGYAALIFKGPRAGFWIALLYGFGLGLVFDEFGLWLNLREGAVLRWSETGLLIVAGAFFTGIVCFILLKRLSRRADAQSLPVALQQTIRTVELSNLESADSSDNF